MTEFFNDTWIVLLIVFSIIATLAVVLRFWARRIQKARLELNDYMIVLGLIFALAEAIMFMCNLHMELWVGTVIENPRDPVQEEFYYTTSAAIKLSFLSQIFWAIAVTFIRSSIILLYIRIFPGRSFRLTCYAVLTLNGAFSIGSILADCLICIPISCQWVFIGDLSCRSCANRGLFDLFNAIISLLLDITVVLLPTPVLWGLQMAVNKKLMLSGMFGLGTAICAITVYRLQNSSLGPFGADYDFEFIPTTTFLMCLEAILGVLNACLPVLKPVFTKVRDSVKKFSGWKGISDFLKFGSIPIFMRVRQMWGLRSEKRAEREELNSMVSMEEWSRNQNGIGSTSKAERVMGMKVSEIHVRRDIHVESASGEDQISVFE